MSRFVVFDVETPNRYNNRMSAIGISVVESGFITDSFFSYVNPEQPFDWFNTQLTGIDESVVADAPVFPELWEKIEPLFSSGTLVAHNAAFDLGVVKNSISSQSFQYPRRPPCTGEGSPLPRCCRCPPCDDPGRSRSNCTGRSAYG